MARIEQASKNIKYSICAYVINNLLKFVVCLAFVRSLSIKYLGINGLFTNLLVMLSLAELGVGPAIVYSLYKTLAEKDIEAVKALMRVFQKAYTAIGILLSLPVSVYCHGWTGLLKGMLSLISIGFM